MLNLKATVEDGGLNLSKIKELFLLFYSICTSVQRNLLRRFPQLIITERAGAKEHRTTPPRFEYWKIIS